MIIDTGRIRSYHASPECVAASLSPDNLQDMEMHVASGYVEMVIHGKPVGSVLATVDDYLMNLSIADTLCCENGERKEQKKGIDLNK
ncbi:hypothetical protein FTO68_05895 [Methanocalculus taiwanensis]|uniref:Antitoxin n=1 Tax=Methanocalculus taiwanensis TaxID=106207 RepID=A0ABD4TJR6_9EURY|nr:KEOPS complex subunit Pcc1 [Methanocalculus taiwanensis]MCQ1538517.1 hypothetical protein [Methanocalculus taiwanensis]